jgi:hypothetical protein
MHNKFNLMILIVVPVFDIIILLKNGMHKKFPLPLVGSQYLSI